MSTEKPTLLVVEDAPENIDMLAELLSAQYELKIAITGEDAFDILTETLPDLILLDVVLPGIDGFEVCEKLRADKATHDVPVIFLTSESDAEKVVHGFKVGGQDYISKPFRAEELLSRVQTQIELQQKRADLEKMNEKLEDKVRERTQELQKANEKMQELNKELEAANEELRSLDEAKSKFISLISHELRTPLTGIMGFTDILNDALKDTKHQKAMNALKGSVDRLNAFSEKALLITKIQSDKGTMDKSVESVVQMLDQALENVEKPLFRKKLQVERHYGDASDILVNSELFIECLDFVLDNAVKYSPQEGKLVLKTGQLNGQVQIIIQDEGEGFSEDALKTAFQFYEPGEEHVDQNVGLGLATAKLIMDVHNGDIRIENTESGARVELIVPRAIS